MEQIRTVSDLDFLIIDCPSCFPLSLHICIYIYIWNCYLNTLVCPGNWAFHWGEAGANSIACSDSYMGPSPASEPETASVQTYICQNNATVKGYVNLHSYSQTWMSNWGYTDELPPDYQQQNELSQAVVAAIKSVHGVEFDYGPIATAIYPASGSSADYTYGVCGVKYSYGAELRDQVGRPN